MRLLFLVLLYILLLMALTGCSGLAPSQSVRTNMHATACGPTAVANLMTLDNLPAETCVVSQQILSHASAGDNFLRWLLGLVTIDGYSATFPDEIISQCQRTGYTITCVKGGDKQLRQKVRDLVSRGHKGIVLVFDKPGGCWHYTTFSLSDFTVSEDKTYVLLELFVAERKTQP